MRKFFVLFFSITIISSFLIAVAQPAQPYPDHGGGSGTGSGGVVTWERHDSDCKRLPNHPIRQKTNCIKDGKEQCTAQYCN